MTDDLEVLARLSGYHDHIAAPSVPVADDVRRGRRRVARRRTVAAGGAGLAVAAIVLAAFVVTPGDPDGAPQPAHPSPTPVTPSPTPERSQSPDTWVDTAVAAGAGYGWDVPDPLAPARDAWFAVATDHLGTPGPALQRLESSPFGVTFERPTPGSIYSTFGRLGLEVDGPDLNSFDGCRYLTLEDPSNGTTSCSEDRFAGPQGERARIARWDRTCGAFDGTAAEYAFCGDYRVLVAVERRDGLIGYVLVDGRGAPDRNPFSPAAMAAVAADPRLTLPAAAYAVPSDQAVLAVLQDHVRKYRPEPQVGVAPHPGTGQAWVSLGGTAIGVQVFPAGDDPSCGRTWLLDCVARRVYGADDPTTVFVGAWDEENWAGCCPRNSRADSRVFVYVGPRHTVMVREGMIVKDGEPPMSAELDRRLIDLALDSRLQ